MIAIIDYGIGNIASIVNMFKRVGVRDVVFTKDIDVIGKCDKILLPGVGSFDNGMQHLKNAGVIDILNKRVLVDKVPVLGICLGMQLLTKRSDEGSEPGLGWIDAETLRFEFGPESALNIPHMGWNYITLKNGNNLLFEKKPRKFYFVHSYYVKCKNENDVMATANYGIEFTCMINKDNIYGAQFHPEKSHKFGMELFENFSKL